MTFNKFAFVLEHFSRSQLSLCMGQGPSQSAAHGSLTFSQRLYSLWMRERERPAIHFFSLVHALVNFFPLYQTLCFRSFSPTPSVHRPTFPSIQQPPSIHLSINLGISGFVYFALLLVLSLLPCLPCNEDDGSVIFFPG